MTQQARRYFLRKALGMIPAVCLAPAALRQVHASESCAALESESLRSSLNYQVKAANPQQACSACSFFAREDSGSCGDCQIMSGPVDASGHCDSWSPKS